MAKEESGGSWIRVLADVVFTLFSIGFFVYIIIKCYLHFRKPPPSDSAVEEVSEALSDDLPNTLIKSQPDLERRMVTRKISNNFKLIYCKTLRKPMMIGLENGRTKHFEWEDGQNAFVSECRTCRFDEGAPPSYISMFG